MNRSEVNLSPVLIIHIYNVYDFFCLLLDLLINVKTYFLVEISFKIIWIVYFLVVIFAPSKEMKPTFDRGSLMDGFMSIGLS